MSESNVDLVLCDVGNVIVRATHEVTHAILRDLGVPYTTAVQFFTNEYYRAFARGRITATEFGERERVLMGCIPSIPQLYCAHNAHIYDEDEGVVVLLDALRSRGIPLAFATDTNEWQTARERELVDLARYGRAFRSHELGALKTDGGVFERILVALGGGDAHRVFFVDDSPEKVAHAAALGMTTHRFTSAAVLREELVRLGLIR